MNKVSKFINPKPSYVESDEDLPPEVNPETSFEDEPSSSEEDETAIEKELKIFTENVLKQIKKTAEVAMIPSARIKDIINFTMNFQDGSSWTYDVSLQKKEKYREVITAKQTLPVVDEISEDDSEDEKEEVEEVEEPAKEFSECSEVEKPVKKEKKNKKEKTKEKTKKLSSGSEKTDSKPENQNTDSKETTASKPFNILPFNRKKPEPDVKSHVSLDITKSTETTIIANNTALTANNNSNGSNLRGQDAVLRGILPLYSSVGMVPPSVGEIKIPTCLGVVMSLRWELGVTSNLELTN